MRDGLLKPFYISSFGGTATLWINEVLNAHPEIVSFHGTRSIPPHGSGTNDLSPEAFTQGLNLLMTKSSHSKLFGAIHGFYGATLYPSIQAVGGAFCAVTRNPIKRINSLFNHHYKKTVGTGENGWDKRKTVYQDMVDKKFDAIAFDAQNQVKTSAVVEYFMWICEGTLGNDILLFDILGLEYTFKMEKLVTDRDYFANLLSVIGQDNLTISDKYLDKVFTTAETHKHAHVEQSEQDIFDSWPDILKLIYKNNFAKLNPSKVASVYEALDYEVVDNQQDTFEVEHNYFVRK